MARAATADEPEQGEMFPEIDVNDPKQKALLRAAKAYDKAKRERDELLSTAKEKMDTKMSSLIGLLKETKIKQFRHNGLKVELIEGREKVQVKHEGEEGHDDEEADD